MFGIKYAKGKQDKKFEGHTLFHTLIPNANFPRY